MFDPKTFKAYNFFGKRFTAQRIERIRQIIDTGVGLSRTGIARRVAEALQWRNPDGNPKFRAGLAALERLEEMGIVSLPLKRAKRASLRPVIDARQAVHPTPLEASLEALQPLTLTAVATPEEATIWNASVDHHHYLGYKHPFGCQMKYFIRDGQQRILGCLLFEGMTRNLPCRDQLIGWSPAQKNRTRHLVVVNSRFVIFEGVRVPNLASAVLGLAARQLRDDWDRKYHYRPVLMATFVDTERFQGSAYKAAGWQHIGHTRPRSGKTQKAVYWKPLVADFKPILRAEPRKPAPARSRHDLQCGALIDETTTRPWQQLILAVTRIAAAYDARWQSRRRAINSVLILLFVYRLVIAPNRQGYAQTLSQLWRQCQTYAVPLYQTKPVSAAAMCKARDKLDPQAFRDVHTAILEPFEKNATTWNGHRVFAIDGSKFNLPKTLQQETFKRPAPNAAYPQGLVSCLYRLHDKVPYDVDLAPHGDERALAEEHLRRLKPGDVIVYDRGYFSRALLAHHRELGLHAVFRIRRKVATQVEEVLESNQPDTVLTLKPHKVDATARTVRVVNVPESDWILVTTLVDPQTYPIDGLADLYHQRWSIEELYKTVKQTLSMEAFHAQSFRGVQQELIAGMTLIALARLMSNDCEMHINGSDQRQARGGLRANQKNALQVVHAGFENMVLNISTSCATIVRRAIACIADCMQWDRPHHSYHRFSQKPTGKWKPPKPS